MNPFARLWDRHVLPPLIRCACGGRAMHRARAPLLARARGRVADIGFGAGANLAFLDPARVTGVVAIEPSGPMLAQARDAIAQSPVPVEIRQATGAETGLPDASVDTVLLTYVLCTIPERAPALAEVRRILRPGGTVLFCEHGLSPDPPVARQQRRIEPVWKALGGGCHLTREVLPALEAAGLVPAEVERFYLRGTPRFAGWTTRGTAAPA